MIDAGGRDRGILTQLTGHPIPDWRALTAPVPASFLSLHLVFVSLHLVFVAGTFNEEIVIDPAAYFSGDEVLMVCRSKIGCWL
jgi:hypothetical protein